MKIPFSWVKDYVEITIPLDELAHQLTMAGLEVEEIRFVGLPMPGADSTTAAGRSGLPRPRSTACPGRRRRSSPQPCWR